MRSFSISKRECELILFFQGLSKNQFVSIDDLLFKFKISRPALFQTLSRLKDKGIADYATQRSDGSLIVYPKVKIIEVQ